MHSGGPTASQSKSAAWSARNREAASPLMPNAPSDEGSLFPMFAASPTASGPPTSATAFMQLRGHAASGAPSSSSSWSRPPPLHGNLHNGSSQPSPMVTLPTLSPTIPPALVSPPAALSCRASPFMQPPTTASLPPAAAANAAPPKVWKKGLYEKQPFDDNYVDPVHFLQELKKNSNLKSYQFGDVMKDTLVIVQQISFVVVFVHMFSLVLRGSVSLSTFVVIDTSLFLAGAVAIIVMRQEMKHQPPLLLEELLVFTRQAIVFVGVIVILSPVFQTLTVSYTDDTIWALGIMAMTVHLLFSDYAYLNSTSNAFSQGVGVNAATFGSVLLASRIHSSLFAAALIAFGILCFNLSPVLRHHLKSYSLMAHVGATFLLCGTTFGCLQQVPLLAGLFTFCVVVICFAVPWSFVKMQARFKNQISGPWDEAKPQNSLAAAEWANAGLLG